MSVPSIYIFSASTEMDLLALQGGHFLFPGKDYVNWIFKDPGDMTRPDVGTYEPIPYTFAF